MPELPEVETFRRQIENVLKNEKLADVVPSKDEIVYAGASPAKIRKALKGAKVKAVKRKGKYLWLELDRRPWPVFHFGMSGSIKVFDEAPEKPPKHVKMILETSDGSQIYFRDPRRFSRIRLYKDPLAEAPLSLLGPDPLEKFPSATELFKSLHRRKAPIKSVLLDQTLFAGVGNWIADEILFQAGINPHRKASELDESEVKTLRTKMLSIVSKAVELGADYDDFPESWLFHHRWGKQAGEVSTGDEIVHDTIGGRTTAWVPRIQK